MLERHYNAERINQILNHPSVLPTIRGNHKNLDWSKVAEHPSHVSLVGEHGCVLFVKIQDGIYEFHTSVLPEGRGKWMIEGAKYAFNYMFTRTDAFELLTKCPDGNLAAKAGAKAVGCSFVFRTGEIWPSDGKMVCVDVWSILIQHWIKTNEFTVDSGKFFHMELEKKCAEKNISLVSHKEDETHDRYVGAAVEMLKNGQTAKAIVFYNRWARMAGYYPIKLLSLTPITVDIRDCILRISGNDFDVIAI